MGCKEGFEMVGTDFLFTLDDALDVEWQVPGRAQPCINGRSVNNDARLVVSRSAAVHSTISHGRFEWRTRPGCRIASWLNVVVCVKQ